MTTENNTGDSNVTREQWLKSFKEGFKAGVSERSRQPKDRRDSLPNGQSDAEYECVEAAQAGYELGKKNAYPGADIDIEKHAHATFDRSEYSTGLDQWGVE